jgi:hypothetical protein
MDINYTSLVTPNYLKDSLEYLYKLPISQEKDIKCQRVLRKRDLLVLGLDHETRAEIRFKFIELNEENIKWMLNEWHVNDSLFYYAKVERCDFPVTRAVADLIKQLESLQNRKLR